MALGRVLSCDFFMVIFHSINERRLVLAFTKRRFNVLITTDVAVCGLDIPNIDLVIHYELPTTSEFLRIEANQMHTLL